MSNSVNDSPEHDGGTKVVRLVPSTTNVPTNLDPYRSLGGYGMPGEEQGGLGIDQILAQAAPITAPTQPVGPMSLQQLQAG